MYHILTMISSKSKEYFSLLAIVFVTIIGIFLGWAEGVQIIDTTIAIISSVCIISGILYLFIQIRQHIEKEELKKVDLSKYIGYWTDEYGEKRRPILNRLKRQDQIRKESPYFIDKGGAM